MPKKAKSSRRKSGGKKADPGATPAAPATLALPQKSDDELLQEARMRRVFAAAQEDYLDDDGDWSGDLFDGD
jgi:hypothetical protein